MQHPSHQCFVVQLITSHSDQHSTQYATTHAAALSCDMMPDCHLLALLTYMRLALWRSCSLALERLAPALLLDADANAG
jgi:hypothetical protein